MENLSSKVRRQSFSRHRKTIANIRSLIGLRLIDPTFNWQSDLIKDSSLSFRSFVNPALIPLYARAGPNLELHTTDKSTAQWLKDKLLSGVWLEEEGLDKFQSMQCPVGLLVGVEGTRKTSGLTTSDFLVYGVLSSTTSYERPPTPPISSSSEYPENSSPVTRQGLKIYASPLSATVITKAHALLTPPRNPDGIGDDAQFAEFLPDLRSPSPKRKRVASLFDSVAQHHIKVRQKGGEAVAQIMAPSHSQSSQQLQPPKIKRESEEPSLPALDRIASHRQRSMSIGGNLKLSESRPSSSRGHVRGLVSRKNTPTPFVESSMKREYSPPDVKPELSSTSPKDAETLISENKNTITRTILTCMRLYGFNRPSTRSGSKHTEEAPDPRPPTADGTASTVEEDEFKVMYHATYRASTFALRKYLKDPFVNGEGVKVMPPLLEKKKAMGYIDEFLRLFCEEN